MDESGNMYVYCMYQYKAHETNRNGAETRPNSPKKPSEYRRTKSKERRVWAIPNEQKITMRDITVLNHDFLVVNHENNTGFMTPYFFIFPKINKSRFVSPEIRLAKALRNPRAPTLSEDRSRGMAESASHAASGQRASTQRQR